MVMMATSSRESGCWDSLGCPCGIVYERDPWKRTQKQSRFGLYLHREPDQSPGKPAKWRQPTLG